MCCLVLWVRSNAFLVVSSSPSVQTSEGLGRRMTQSESGAVRGSAGEILILSAAPYAVPASSRSPKSQPHCLGAFPARLFRYRVIKRLGDLFVVALLIPILLPLILFLALIVRVTSQGPAFFSHRRICEDGAFFSMWKFRTMAVDSTEVLERYFAAHPGARREWNESHKLQHDPRVTKIGRVMRRYSLDELPQVWNVITGRMSLVGPRPIVAAEVEKYGACFSCYTRVKPGVTGLWQVSGRSTLPYGARVRLDCEYVARWSLFVDFKILLLTARHLVNQEGAF